MVHVADAVEHDLQLLPFLKKELSFLLGGVLELDVRVETIELLEPLDPASHGLEVGEGPANPPVDDVGHLDPFGGRLDDRLGLPLGPDEEHLASAHRRIGDEGVGLLELPQRVLKVDDVDAVPDAEDVPFHFRVPFPRYVSEMYPCLEQFFHADRSQCDLL